jgi:hypothetical protein
VDLKIIQNSEYASVVAQSLNDFFFRHFYLTFFINSEMSSEASAPYESTKVPFSPEFVSST